MLSFLQQKESPLIALRKSIDLDEFRYMIHPGRICHVSRPCIGFQNMFDHSRRTSGWPQKFALHHAGIDLSDDCT